jgi:hypothetical protein
MIGLVERHVAQVVQRVRDTGVIAQRPPDGKASLIAGPGLLVLPLILRQYARPVQRRGRNPRRRAAVTGKNCLQPAAPFTEMAPGPSEAPDRARDGKADWCPARLLEAPAERRT